MKIKIDGKIFDCKLNDLNELTLLNMDLFDLMYIRRWGNSIINKQPLLSDIPYVLDNECGEFIDCKPISFNTTQKNAIIKFKEKIAFG